MGVRLVNVDRETPMLLPPDLRDWVPSDHIVHFVLDAVEALPERDFEMNWRGSGSEQYPPRMMLALLIYSYATGRFSSRDIEAASYSDVIIRYICGGDQHPDHDTICTFRRNNRKMFEGAFVKVLLMAKEAKVLKRVGTVAVDGTKVQANASKHAAVSYKWAGEQIEFLQEEVKKLMAKAEDADRKPLEDGLKIPKEIRRREDRIARLEKAREVIEQRYAEHEKAVQAKKEEDKSERKGKNQRKSPPDEMQYNFTDPDSRIMKAGSGQHFEQSYNAQAVVDTGSMLVVGQRVSQKANDKKELQADVESVSPAILKVKTVLADSGFYSEEAVQALEADGKIEVLAAVAKGHHGMTVAELEKTKDPRAPSAKAPMIDRMKHRLATKKGKALYRFRKQTVEPVFGIIKEVMGFRRFSLRGAAKVATEWALVCLAYNTRRVFSLLSAALKPVGGRVPVMARS